MLFDKLISRYRSFRDDEDGSYTVEMVLWFPALLVAFQFVVDATVSLLYQQSFYNLARDASRMVSLGQRTTEEATAFIYAELSHVDEVVATVLIENNFVTSTIEAPLEEIAGMSGRFVDRDMSAKVSMWVENFEGS